MTFAFTWRPMTVRSFKLSTLILNDDGFAIDMDHLTQSRADSDYFGAAFVAVCRRGWFGFHASSICIAWLARLPLTSRWWWRGAW
jgi:hypothetical protein